MKKEMLINVLQQEECRIAIVENGLLEELYVERTSQESYVGNIYKGRIVNIEPSIQAAFVDFGIGRNGFLHVSDVDAKYYRHKLTGDPRSREGLADMLDLPEVEAINDEDLLDDDDEPVAEERDEAHDHHDSRDEEQSFREVPERAEPLPEPPQESVRPERSRREEGYERPPRSERPREGRRPPEERRPPDNAPPMRRYDVPPPHPQGGTGDEELGLPPVLPWQEGELQAMPAMEQKDRGERGGRRGRSRHDRSRAEETTAWQEPPPLPAPAASSPPPTPSGAEPPRRRFGEGLFEPDEEQTIVQQTPPPRPMPSAERTLPAPKAEEPSVPQSVSRPIEDVSPPPLMMEDQRRDQYDAELPEVEDPADFPPHDEEHPLYKDQDQMEEHPHLLGDHEPDDEEDDDEGDDQRRSRRRRRPRSRMRVARPKPPIQEIFRRGQEVLVQVIKEGLGTKGPTLSTYISIPGRYLVLMPGLNRIGVSRKIPDDEQRKKLRDFLQDLKPPQGLGFIIRTAGLDRTKRELHRDLAYLTRLWKVVIRRIKKSKSPTMIYQESDIITRTIRDVFTSEIETIRVDEPAAYEHAQEFLQVVMPRYAERLVLDIEQEPFFHRYGLESEIARIQQRRLPLPQGGSIVIEQTEALVAIDVNSGNFRQDNDAEETAFRVNLTAAKEIARQLRLRDMGGVIIIDFIDMREEHHRRELERTLRDAVKRDRARTKILKMSQFGIVEMTRQRIRPSLKRSSFEDCSHCRGNGQVKTAESMSIEVMRWLQLAAHRNVNRIQVRVTEAVAQYLLNRKRKEIAQLEETGKMSVTVFGSQHAPPEMLEFTCYDSNGGEIKLAYPDTPPSRGRGGRRLEDRERERR